MVFDKIMTKHGNDIGRCAHICVPFLLTDDVIDAAVADYAKSRCRDAQAIANLALYNYIEVRASVCCAGMWANPIW